ncbi:MAG: hypothetical protein JXR73_07015, partial [Candidatus Omnitrophica bacterium]|nr:hypothetical protein [Candidatus Omnitrophota bacterium]
MKKRQFLSIFACLIGRISLPALAEELRCGRCGKIIKGRYITYSINNEKKLIVCQSCDQSLPKCDACGLP